MAELTLSADILDIVRIQGELDDAKARMTALLGRIGTEENCPGCGERIIWVRHRGGKIVAYDPNGGPHYEPPVQVERK